MSELREIPLPEENPLNIIVEAQASAPKPTPEGAKA